MSSPASAPLLVIEPVSSRRLRLAWWALHAAAIGAIALLSFPWLLPALILLGVGAAVEAPRLQGRGRIEARADGSWRVARPSGRLHAHLAAGTFCSRWLVVLSLRTGEGVLRRVLLPDALDRETWRRLRVRLRNSQRPA